MPDTPAPAAVTSAREAAEAIRAINHQTIASNGGLDLPSDLYATVGTLAAMAERLPQALRQLERIAREMAERPDLYDDRDRAAVATADGAAECLNEAAKRMPAVWIRAAANRLSHLGVRDA